ncbi:MAG TPA: hypothetical protein VKH36_14605, partial [Acidimicrobiia bacterium]|nr:hypothetical protein [Acidimicrobiia bacterium]
MRRQNHLVVEHEATTFVLDEPAGRLGADALGIVPGDAGAQGEAAVERPEQRVEPQGAVVAGL